MYYVLVTYALELKTYLNTFDQLFELSKQVLGAEVIHELVVEGRIDDTAYRIEWRGLTNEQAIILHGALIDSLHPINVYICSGESY